MEASWTSAAFRMLQPRKVEALEDLDDVLNAPEPSIGAPAGIGLPLRTPGNAGPAHDARGPEQHDAALPVSVRPRAPLGETAPAPAEQPTTSPGQDSWLATRWLYPSAVTVETASYFGKVASAFTPAALGASVVGGGVGAILAGPLGLAAGVKTGLALGAGTAVAGGVAEAYAGPMLPQSIASFGLRALEGAQAVTHRATLALPWPYQRATAASPDATVELRQGLLPGLTEEAGVSARDDRSIGNVNGGEVQEGDEGAGECEDAAVGAQSGALGGAEADGTPRGEGAGSDARESAHPVSA